MPQRLGQAQLVGRPQRLGRTQPVRLRRHGGRRPIWTVVTSCSTGGIDRKRNAPRRTRSQRLSRPRRRTHRPSPEASIARRACSAGSQRARQADLLARQPDRSPTALVESCRVPIVRDCPRARRHLRARCRASSRHRDQQSVLPIPPRLRPHPRASSVRPLFFPHAASHGTPHPRVGNRWNRPNAAKLAFHGEKRRVQSVGTSDSSVAVAKRTHPRLRRRVGTVGERYSPAVRGP